MLKDFFTAERTLLAVMSYNRGKYLQNCMQSIERHMPGFEAVIFDDHSTDAETVKALRDLSSRHKIVDCKAGSAGDRGGLHANMNRALELAIHDDYRFVLFLQDDMQFVRDIDDDLIDNVNAIFGADEKLAQVNVMFFKGYWPKAVMQSRIGIQREVGYYYHIPSAGWNCGIADSGITSLERICEKGFRYQDSEASSIVTAQSLDLHRADCRDPIMMFTPWPGTTSRSYSEKISLKRIAREMLVKMQEYGASTDCHPFLPMSAESIARLKQRPIEEYPIAERYLSVEQDLLQPWWYSACNNISDFKSVRSLLAMEWFTKGPANYRANVRRQQESDAEHQR